MSALPAETTERWTSTELEMFPENGLLYEIIAGELFVSKQPHWHHQGTCSNIVAEIIQWIRSGGGGQVVAAPGVIFDEENDVAPDVVWVSQERLPAILGEDGKLHGAPDLVVEVVSPGAANIRRDREAKLELYSQRGVLEYWVADWRAKSLEAYRREGNALNLAATLGAEDELKSPLLPGFKVPLARLFPG